MLLNLALISLSHRQLSLVEMSRLYTRLIKLIQLRDGTILGLGQPKPAAQETKECRGPKNESDFASEISCIWIEHVGKDEADEPLHKAEDKV